MLNFNFNNDGSYPLLLFAILFFLKSLTLVGQNSENSLMVPFSGIVKDSENKLPIEYAHVYIQGSTTGTVTNSLGEFIIKVPAELSSNEISFSIVGYKSKSAQLTTGSNFSNEIFLTPSSYQLNEITVSADRFDSASYILDEAIKFIKFNYPRKPHLMEGFFRELSLKDTIYTRLIEAAVRVQEVGYNKNTYDNNSLEMTKNRVKVIELRKSDDFRDRDLLTSALNLLFGNRNELYMILNANYVRVLGKKSHHFLSEKNIKKLDIEYSGRTEWEGQTVFIISLKNLNEQNFQWTEFNFYINKSDFAIVKIERRSIANPARKDIKSGWLIDGKYFATSETSYRKIGNKYFPVFIHAKHSPSDASPIVEEGGKTVKQYIDLQFLLTNVYEDDYSRIRWRDTEDRNKDLYESETPYNKEFWNSYNTVKLNPLKRDPKELEKNRSLKEQFHKN